MEIKIKIPWHWGKLSKNARLVHSRSGGVAVSRGAKAVTDDIFWLVKEQLLKKKIKFSENKVFLDIMVYRRAGKLDAINVLDTIADAIKPAIGIDDQWFAIKRLDWEVIKSKEQQYVTVIISQ